MEVLLKINDLSKIFTIKILNNKRIEALKKINIQINKGEIIGLAGKSGSGKSTLVKCIYRTYLPSSGNIFYESKLYGNIDLATANDYEVLALRKSEITYCSQFLRVIPRIPAALIVGEHLVTKGSSWEYAKEKAKDLLYVLGLPEELWDAYPSTFSGGEQQRVNVAKAVIAEPDFLLIDEPTASLDQKAKEKVIDLILKLKSNGTSILCISHDSFTMSKLTDKTIELKEGTLYQN